MASKKVLTLGTILLICKIDNANAGSTLQCKDESGQNVDWVILYKLPMMKSPDPDDAIDEGISYAFLTSNSVQSGWKLSDASIDSPHSIPAKILDPLYKSKNYAYIFYNDEHPDGHVSFTGGHTKGVVGFEKDEGFWMIHSVPKYPPEAGYGYPKTGHRYGQTFLCISFKTEQTADDIGQLLFFNNPSVYMKNIPKWAEKYSNFVKASEGGHVTDPPFYVITNMRSSSNVLFTAFAKYTEFGKDLYADLVAPALKINLLVETWPNGPGKMNSSCDKPFHVMNIDGLDFKGVIDKKGREMNFTTKHDHAKWAVGTHASDNHMRNMVCIGDINRMLSQEKRGGGTVCFQNRAVWKAFTLLIYEIEVCPTGVFEGEN